MSLRDDPFGFIENTVRSIIDKFANVHQGSVITVTQARYAAYLTTTLERVRAGEGRTRKGSGETCPCVGEGDDCSPETVAEVLDTLDMFNKPEGDGEQGREMQSFEGNGTGLSGEIVVQALGLKQ